MELLLSVSAPDAKSSDVIADLDATCSVRELVEEVARFLGLGGSRVAWSAYCERLQRQLEPERAVGETELRNGDHLRLSPRSSARLGADESAPSTRVVAKVVSGQMEGKAFELPQGEHLLGRSEECDLVLDDDRVSRRHMWIKASAGGVSIRDNGSLNGTFLEGARVGESWQAVPPGHIVKVGGSLISFELRRADGSQEDALARASRTSRPGRQPEGLPATVLVTGGPMAGESFELGPGQHLVGRDSDCQIVLTDPQASGRHLWIKISPEGVSVRDNGSRNGTFVEGTAVGERWRLVRPGEVVKAGRTLLSFKPFDASFSPYIRADEKGRIPFNRPPRVSRPFKPESLKLAAPPRDPQKPRLPLATAVAPFALGALLLVFWVISGAQGYFFIYSLLFIALSPLIALWSFLEDRRTGKRRFRQDAAEFYKKLDALAHELERARAREAQARRQAAPDAAELTQRAKGHLPNLWERRRTDEDFLSLRVGSADQPSETFVEIEHGGSEALRAEALERIKHYSIVPFIPAIVSLDGAVVGVSGRAAAVDAIARWLVVQAGTLHSPQDLLIAAAVDADRLQDWSWLKWLPHTHPDEPLVPGPQVAGGIEESRYLFERIRELIEQRQKGKRENPAARNRRHSSPALLLVIDEAVVGNRAWVNPILSAEDDDGIGVLWLGGDVRDLPGECSSLVELDPSVARLKLTDVRSGTALGDVTADGLTPEFALEIARALAPLRDVSAPPRRARDHSEQTDGVRLLELMGLPGPQAVDPSSSRLPSRKELLRAPIGLRSDGETLTLDLKEAAEGGMGPHGLLVGAVGSGKSELLRTLVSALAISHPPELLNFVFADFKGAAAFAGLAELPHCAGMISDLENDPAMVDRMHAALEGEKERRERLLHEAGNVDNIRQYHASAAKDGLEPLPYLLIIVDEFAELLDSRPDFRRLFVSIGRTGRSLGIHLLLATQSLGEGRIQGLERHLRYRICLRTFSAQESMLVLGTTDAFDLPPLPGAGYLKVDGAYHEFRTALITTPHRERVRPTRPRIKVGPFLPTMTRAQATAVIEEAPAESGEGSEMKAVIDRLVDAAERTGNPRARQVWLPPLEEAIPLDRVLPPLESRGKRRAAGVKPGSSHFLHVPIGMLDRPREQAQEALALDFSSAEGHLAVAGSLQTGKSTLLATLIAAFALTHSPRDVQFYCVDLGGGALHQLETLPHVGAVCGRLERDKVFRMVRELQRVMEERALWFRKNRIASIADYRERRRKSPSAAGHHGDVFLVIDNWALLRQDFAELEAEIEQIVTTGLRYGLHVVLTTNAWSEIRSSLRDNFGARLELRLNNPNESEVGRTSASGLPSDVPGRGLIRPGLQFQTALPRIDGRRDARELQGALQSLVATATQRWAGAGTAAPISEPGPASETRSEALGLAELLDVADMAEVDPRQTWREQSSRELLRVPFGVNQRGDPLYLDLKESALGGMGPHGLMVGATGSGKSELLRTLVVALAIKHSPDQLSFVLVDFKGGAAFAGLAELPHVAGMITNLQDDLALVDRMHDALYGEQRRRQQILRAAGNVASLNDYNQRRAAGADLAPLPYLLIIVDEFAELLDSRPDFIDLFVTIGRVGRSLGMHLLLASQRLDEGRLRGLDSHLRYRIGLRTFSAMESRTVLGVPDAYNLPPEPGGGYLKVDTTTFERFKAAWASAPYTKPKGSGRGARGGRSARVRGKPDDPQPRLLTPTVTDVAVARLHDAAPRVHQVWLPPLQPAVTLDQLLPQIARDRQRGLTARGWGDPGGLAVPIGLVDRPQDQAQESLIADFSGAEGNLAIVGAPQSGKSTLLRTILSAFVLTHKPEEVQFYCIDYGGGTLKPLEGAPHVGTVATRLDADLVRRVVGEIEAVIAHRERLFRENRIDSAAHLRALRAQGELPDEVLGDVFLVVDNWPALRQGFEYLEAAVVDIASRGLGYGIHVIVSANRWMDVRPNLRDSLGGRLELRLNDPADSVFDRRIAANVPRGVPGRGLTKENLHFQAALPRIDGRAETGDMQAATDDLVAQVDGAWAGPAAPPVRLLPTHFSVAELPPPDGDTGRGVPIGIAETDFQPVYLDLTGADPHFLVFGDGESGKTNFLRVFLEGLASRYSPEEASILVIDYRRKLLDAASSEHLFAYAGAAPAASSAVARLRDDVVGRLPTGDLSPQQLRERNWWAGPHYYVVVDDYDLVVTPTGNPLQPLVEFLAQGSDLGLHVVLARRVAGVSRAFEPFFQRLKDLGSPGLILSGDRQEGPLIGPYRATEQVPGRGLLVRRKQQPLLIQVPMASVEPDASALDDPGIGSSFH